MRVKYVFYFRAKKLFCGEKQFNLSIGLSKTEPYTFQVGNLDEKPIVTRKMKLGKVLGISGREGGKMVMPADFSMTTFHVIYANGHKSENLYIFKSNAKTLSEAQLQKDTGPSACNSSLSCCCFRVRLFITAAWADNGHPHRGP